MQGTLVREHVSVKGTLIREHARHVGTWARKARSLADSEIEALIQILSETLIEKLLLNLDSKYRWKAFTSQHWNVVYS